MNTAGARRPKRRKSQVQSRCGPGMVANEAERVRDGTGPGTGTGTCTGTGPVPVTGAGTGALLIDPCPCPKVPVKYQ